MVSAVVCGSSGAGSSLVRGLVLCQTLNSHSVSLPAVPEYLMLKVTLYWTSIPSRGEKNTPSSFMLQIPG